MTTVNYDAIVQALKERADEISDRFAGQLRLRSADGIFIRDLRTVGFHAPRQSGRSLWAMNTLVKNPGTILITVNKPIRDNLVLRQCRGDNEFVKGVVKATICDIDRRVLTVKDLMALMGERGSISETPGVDQFDYPCRVEQIILDDATFIFQRVRPTKFYDWAAGMFEHFGVEKPYVVLVN